LRDDLKNISFGDWRDTAERSFLQSAVRRIVAVDETRTLKSTEMTVASSCNGDTVLCFVEISISNQSWRRGGVKSRAAAPLGGSYDAVMTEEKNVLSIFSEKQHSSITSMTYWRGWLCCQMRETYGSAQKNKS